MPSDLTVPVWIIALVSLFQALLFSWAQTESGPMPGFAWIAAVYILIAVYALYRLGMQLARVRLVPVVVRGGRA